MVRVTVGMPVFNGERFVSETIESILEQSFEDFELLISDNSSTDGTEEICRSFVSQDSRVRYVRCSVNNGLAWNHNYLVELARGSLFKWTGADDIFHRDLLSRCVEELDGRSDAVLAFPRSVAIDSNGKTLYEYSPQWELTSDSPGERLRSVLRKGGHWLNADATNGVIRIDALRQTRLIPSYLGGDKRTLAELAVLGKFVEVEEYFHFRRFHEESTGSNNPADNGYSLSSVKRMREMFRCSKAEACMPTWMLLRDRISVVRRSGLSVADRLRCYESMLRACWWYRSYYVEELANARHLLS